MIKSLLSLSLRNNFPPKTEDECLTVFVTETTNGKIMTRRDHQRFVLVLPWPLHVHSPVCARSCAEPLEGLPGIQLPGRYLPG